MERTYKVEHYLLPKIWVNVHDRRIVCFDVDVVFDTVALNGAAEQRG